VHTQPDYARPGSADFEFIDDFADDITGFIFGPNEAYRYQKKGPSMATQQQIANVGNILGCDKNLSNYYY